MIIYFVSDSEINAFYTAIFDCLKSGGIITSRQDFQLTLGDTVINVESDCTKCEEVKTALLLYDRYASDDIAFALRSGDNNKEQTVFGYVKILLKTKAPVIKRMNLDEILKFNALTYKITGELHRLKGLLRFIECENGVLYAPYSPDNNITDLLAEHFKHRLSCEKFVIHDIKRKLATIYDGNSLLTGKVGNAEIYVSEREKEFENLWKKYYKSVNIESRPHTKQMKGSMPVRYWKFLPEKQD